MSATDATSRRQDEPSRSRLRAETPPPGYWRRWTADAPAPVPLKGGMSAMTASSPPPATGDVPPVPGNDAGGAAPAASSRTGDTQESPYRVLIVEDDRGQALFAQSVLHGAGMQAEVQMAPDAVIELDARALNMTEGIAVTATLQPRPAWRKAGFSIGRIDLSDR
jgi:hypothetical protein